jgi:hypothetical protein
VFDLDVVNNQVTSFAGFYMGLEQDLNFKEEGYNTIE